MAQTYLNTLSPDLIHYISEFNRLPHRWIICVQGYDGKCERPIVYTIDPSKLPQNILDILSKYEGGSFESAIGEFMTYEFTNYADDEEDETGFERFNRLLDAADTHEVGGFIVDHLYTYSAA